MHFLHNGWFWTERKNGCLSKIVEHDQGMFLKIWWRYGPRDF
jgi:hypothetical protein